MQCLYSLKEKSIKLHLNQQKKWSLNNLYQQKQIQWQLKEPTEPLKFLIKFPL